MIGASLHVLWRFRIVLVLACTFRKYVCKMYFFFFVFVWVNRKCFTFENFPSSRRAVEAAFDSISMRFATSSVGNVTCR